ncbi:O-antigen ligase domain-containing protein [Patescibacteria group bacterium]|nr:MAG: O-antigen ligase domain-containing protein [Patescibacteria group bacterium]
MNYLNMFSFFKQRPIFSLIFTLASVELFSFFGYLHPQAGVVLFWLIIAAVLVVSFWRLEYGLLIALIELFIGSKGYLFSFDINGTVVSVRIAIFLIVITVWLTKKIFSKKVQGSKFWISNLSIWYIFLFAALAVGLIQAIILRNNYGNIFFDFNAFLFFAYLFPLAEILREKINWERLGKAAIASVSWVAIKTFLIFYVFAHGMWPYTPMVYKWIRDTGVGEITKMDQAFYRIFFQGQIYELLALIIILGIIGHLINKGLGIRDKGLANKRYWLLGAGLTAVVILSFSRSFWVGGAAGIFALVFLLIFVLKAKWRAIGIFSLYSISIFAIGFILIFALMNIPPRKGKPASLSSLVSERATTQEAAGLSRMELLKPLWTGILKHPIIGSGFGASITYNSKDPRILQNNPSGEYTTFAFEWGYLDLWYKMGILGPLAYLGLIGSASFALWRVIKEKSEMVLAGINVQAMSLGVFAALIALAAVHFFTPYLNHPLGIGFVILSSIFAVFVKNREKQI